MDGEKWICSCLQKILKTIYNEDEDYAKKNKLGYMVKVHFIRPRKMEKA